MSDMFNEITFSYNILSDPDKRHQYDTAGFEAVETEGQDLELDLSSLSTMNTMFAAIFRKVTTKKMLADQLHPVWPVLTSTNSNLFDPLANPTDSPSCHLTCLYLRLSLKLRFISLYAMHIVAANEVRIKTTVLEEALKGSVTIQPITLGQPVAKKVC